MQFSFSRFMYSFKLQLAVNRKLYLLGMVAIVGLMLCFMLFCVYATSNGLDFTSQNNGVSVGMLFCSAVFGSMIFKQYSDKNRRTQSILLPVSTAERLAVAVLFTFFLFPLVFILLYFICVIPVNALDVSRGNMNEIFMLDGAEGWFLFLGFLYVQSLVLMCAISFRRYTFVKTIVAVCLITLCIVFVNDKIGGTRPEYIHISPAGEHTEPKRFKITNAAPFRSMRLMTVRERKNENEEGIIEYYWVSLPDNQRRPFMLLLGLVPFLTFYITGLKLREQQL